ncbi:MAG TPA: hypothetical protein VGX28_16940 [Frankiaceae bacterium]|jgi:hypothetical protein|nr:hypothetical protein [Frankiaceae bacterium]
MSLEQQVREVLAARAEQVDATPLHGPSLRARAGSARRRTVRRGLVATVAAVAAVAAVLAALLVVPAFERRSLPPATDTVDVWPNRGDLAGDTALLAAAVRAWEAAPVLPQELPHADVRMLLAQRTPYGRYVMLTARNALGHRRLAVLSDDPRDHEPYRERLRLREERAFPDEALLTYVEHRGAGEALVLAVGAPGLTRLAWRDRTDHWRDLASKDGAAAEVVRDPTTEVALRAYRGERRVAQARARGAMVLYRPDEALVTEVADAGPSCDGGVCTGSLSGSVGPGAGLLGVLRPEGTDWRDMADQAEQLWMNHALGTTRLRSWTSGQAVSAMLPDGLGVYLGQHSVNDGPPHLVLYADRPEWPIGRLYLARPFAPSAPPPAVSAVLPGRAGRVLVVFAEDAVGIRYRVAGGAWRALDVNDGIGWARVGAGDVEVETTREGFTVAGLADTSAPL